MPWSSVELVPLNEPNQTPLIATASVKKRSPPITGTGRPLALIVIAFVAELLWLALSVTVSRTAYVPTAPKVATTFLPEAVRPLPKSQSYRAIPTSSVEFVPEKGTDQVPLVANRSSAEVGPVMTATGGLLAVTLTTCVAVLLWFALSVTVNRTV